MILSGTLRLLSFSKFRIKSTASIHPWSVCRLPSLAHPNSARAMRYFASRKRAESDRDPLRFRRQALPERSRCVDPVVVLCARGRNGVYHRPFGRRQEHPAETDRADRAPQPWRDRGCGKKSRAGARTRHRAAAPRTGHGVPGSSATDGPQRRRQCRVAAGDRGRARGRARAGCARRSTRSACLPTKGNRR